VVEHGKVASGILRKRVHMLGPIEVAVDIQANDFEGRTLRDHDTTEKEGWVGQGSDVGTILLVGEGHQLCFGLVVGDQPLICPLFYSDEVSIYIIGSERRRY
jgi:hypothetical protein